VLYFAEAIVLHFREAIVLYFCDATELYFLEATELYFRHVTVLYFREALRPVPIRAPNQGEKFREPNYKQQKVTPKSIFVRM
jgi:hypothetical protein